MTVLIRISQFLVRKALATKQLSGFSSLGGGKQDSNELGISNIDFLSFCNILEMSNSKTDCYEMQSYNQTLRICCGFSFNKIDGHISL